MNDIDVLAITRTLDGREHTFHCALTHRTDATPGGRS